MSFFRPRTALAGLTLLGAASMFAPATTASATALPASVKTILSSGDLYVNNIRGFFFCATKSCKANHTTLQKSAYDGVVALIAEVKAAVKANVGAPYLKTIGQMSQDVTLLATAYNAAARDKTVQLLAADEGAIYYTTAQVATETYLLNVDAGKAKLTFRDWSVGDSATLYAVQVDSQTLAAKNVTANDGAFASYCLEGDAEELLRHADGPSAKYNTLITTFAKNQLAVSKSEILILEGKEAPLTVKDIAKRTGVLAKEFNAIVVLQKSLATA
jgi:hypothetical protein